jgi:hypothetical protein
LIGRFNWTYAAILCGSGIAFYLLAMLAFERREISG